MAKSSPTSAEPLAFLFGSRCNRRSRCESALHHPRYFEHSCKARHLKGYQASGSLRCLVEEDGFKPLRNPPMAQG